MIFVLFNKRKYQNHLMPQKPKPKRQPKSSFAKYLQWPPEVIIKVRERLEFLASQKNRNLDGF
jgi:hypothetical protein